MPVVPIRPQPDAMAPISAAAPPDPNFLLMAAAQMHKEGRLIQQPIRPGQDYNKSLLEMHDASAAMHFRSGFEEWESQGQSDVRSTMDDEPSQKDQTQDIMQHLYRGKDI